MKITQRKLKQIIKEEVQRALKEAVPVVPARSARHGRARTSRTSAPKMARGAIARGVAMPRRGTPARVRTKAAECRIKGYAVDGAVASPGCLMPHDKLMRLSVNMEFLQAKGLIDKTCGQVENKFNANKVNTSLGLKGLISLVAAFMKAERSNPRAFGPTGLPVYVKCRNLIRYDDHKA
jgi:hypothetical protein